MNDPIDPNNPVPSTPVSLTSTPAIITTTNTQALPQITTQAITTSSNPTGALAAPPPAPAAAPAPASATPTSSNVVRNLNSSFASTVTAPTLARVQQLQLTRSSTPKRVYNQVATTTTTTSSSIQSVLQQTTMQQQLQQTAKKQRVEILTWSAPFAVVPDPADPNQTYKQLEIAMSHQNEEAKSRYKNLLLPSINSYPKLTCDVFIRWKKHFEAVCYTTTELYGLLEEGPLQNPIDKPEISDILFNGYNGTVLYFLAQSTYQYVEMYCNKINNHLWQAIMEAIKDDTEALTFASSVPHLDYSSLWSKLCSRWMETAEIRKSKILSQFNDIHKTPKETFKEYYHRLETVINNLNVEFNYIVPDDQIVLKVLHGVEGQLQTLFLYLKSTKMQIRDISKQLIISEEELLLTKSKTETAHSTSSHTRRCFICQSPDHVQNNCPNNISVSVNSK
jgi:hypothetical protein